MILCVTPNPAVDRTYVVPGFAMGEIFRPENVIVAAGGKGINVARAIKILGEYAACAGLLGGHAGRLIMDMLAAEGLESAWTAIDGETRTCVIVADPGVRKTTVINESGAVVTADDWKRLKADLMQKAADCHYISFSGSLPPRSSFDLYADILQALGRAGMSVWVDTSGQPLKVAANLNGINLKVNDAEAGELLGKSLLHVEDVIVAANWLREQGLNTVVLTMGAQGAVLSHETGCWYAQPPSITAVSAVASGDSLLAGLLVAVSHEKSLADALCYGVAAGAANALSIGGGQFDAADFWRILDETKVYSM